ncbi:hypothetical protein L551_0087 [Bordetella pertussis STO1-SEAT-0004]|nr:hypothetical protein L551_0087 [Bordetella pertussis STO1-SEAT-0004]
MPAKAYRGLSVRDAQWVRLGHSESSSVNVVHRHTAGRKDPGNLNVLPTHRANHITTHSERFFIIAGSPLHAAQSSSWICMAFTAAP